MLIKHSLERSVHFNVFIFHLLQCYNWLTKSRFIRKAIAISLKPRVRFHWSHLSVIDSLFSAPRMFWIHPPLKKKQKEGTHKIKTVYELLLTLLLTFDEVYVYCNKVQRCRQQTQNFLRFHVKPSNSINIDFAKTQFKF